MIEIFFIYLFFSLVLSIGIFLYPLQVGKYINLVDKSKSTKLKIHHYDTSKIGGLFIIALIFNFFFYESYIIGINKNLISIYFLFFSFFITGLLDDYLDVSPLARIILYSLFCTIALKLNGGLIVEKFYSELFNKYIDTDILSVFFTVFCFLFLQNILNMLDGINGSLLIFSLTVLLLLLFISFSIFILIFFIILILLLYLNLKNIIFLGNNGSAIISSILGYLLISMHADFPKMLSAEKIIIIFFIPTIDLVRMFIQRILSNNSPFKGDLDHFHHLVLLKYHPKVWMPLLIIFILSSYFVSLFVSSYLIILFMTFIYFVMIKK